MYENRTETQKIEQRKELDFITLRYSEDNIFTGGQFLRLVFCDIVPKTAGFDILLLGLLMWGSLTVRNACEPFMCQRLPPFITRRGQDY